MHTKHSTVSLQSYEWFGNVNVLDRRTLIDYMDRLNTILKPEKLHNALSNIVLRIEFENPDLINR